MHHTNTNVMEIKELDFSKPFQANGKTYRVKSMLSVTRWIQFEITQVELGTGISFDQMIKSWQTVYDLTNKMKFADIAVLAHDTLSSVAKRIEERTHPVMKMCALFCNYEGEDESRWDDDLVKEKQADWEAEGYSMQSFFQLAFSAVQNFSQTYEEISAFTSTEKKPEKNKK